MDTNGEQGNGITQDNLDKICNVLDITEAELRGLNIQRNITSAPKDVVGNVSRTIPFWDVLAVGGNLSLVVRVETSDHKNNKRFFAGAPDEFTTAQHPGF